MHDDFERLIERSLDARSSDLRVGDGSIDDVLLRVDRRSNRRRATAVAGSLAVIAVGLVGLSVVQGAGEPAGPAAGPDTAPATSAPLGLVDGYQDAYRCTDQLDVAETDPTGPKYFAQCQSVLLENGVPIEVVATSVALQAPTTWVACEPFASTEVLATTVPCGTVPPGVPATICEHGDVLTSVWVTVPCVAPPTTMPNDAAIGTVPTTTVQCGSFPNGTVPCAPATTMPTPPVSEVEQRYTVQAGDDLTTIAARFELRIEAIANYNGWPDPTTHPLLAGDTVLIPPGGAIPTD